MQHVLTNLIFLSFVFHLHIFLNNPKKSTMQINIKTLTGRVIPLTCESNELVSKVKEMLRDKEVSRQYMTASSNGFVLLQTRRLTFLQ
jgi:hypothetical protein